MQQHEFEHFIIKTNELFDSLVRYEQEVESDLIVFDLESNSEIEKLAKTYGIGLCFTDKKAFYIPWRYKDGTNVWSAEDSARIIAWLNVCLTRRRVIGHNIIYDALVYGYNFDFIFDEFIHADTILMKHTVEEEPPFALKEIAPPILGPWADKAQEKLKENVLANGGRWTEDHKDMYLADTDVLGEYCCWDVILTLLLYNHFNKEMEKENLTDFFYKDEVMPLYKEATIPMKRAGFPVDIEYFKALQVDLEKEITILEDNIVQAVHYLIKDFEEGILNTKFPMKPTGNFPKYFADLMNIPLPVDAKTNKVTLSKKAIEAQKAASTINAEKVFYDWLLTKKEPPKGGWIDKHRMEVQKELFFKDNPGKKYIFNLDSPAHIGHLLFNCLKIKPFKFTKGGKPSTDKDVLDELIEEYKQQEPWMPMLFDYRKLCKLQSTYVEGILSRHIDGVIYTSMLQFGTTSGRYASRNPNLQNQPRIKDEDSGLTELVLKYVNAIKKGFVANKGYKVVNADYSTLEPRCFAHMSGDSRMQGVFSKGEDLYSLVGIDTFNLTGVSANKKAPNYLGNMMPEMRQKSKEFVLMVPYGAEEAQVSRKMNVSYSEAGDIIRNYLTSFPSLRSYMNKCNYSAKNYGFVKTELGRIRHLKEAKDIHALYGPQILDSKWAKKMGRADTRRIFRNLLNLAKNFPIQGLAAHIVNRAMIAIARRFKAEGLDASIRLQVHDEITCIAREDHAQRAAQIVKECMELTTTITVPLLAEPKIADNWGDSK